MNILIHQWGSVNDNALKYEAEIWSRKYANTEEPILFHDFARKMTNYDMHPEFAMAFLEVIHQKKIDALLGFNYFPMISSICEVAGIKYISWIYDAPHKTLYSKTVFNKCNFIYIFDRQFYQVVRDMGVKNVFYQPLAASPEYFGKQINVPTQKLLEQSELENIWESITFIGMLYRDHHDYYERLTGMKEAVKTNIDTILEQQIFCYKDNIVQRELTDTLAYDIYEKANLHLEDPRYFNDVYEFAADLIRKKATAVEREAALAGLSQKFPVVIYTDVRTDDLPRILNYGYADYDNKMPHVFKESAVNLNITLRSIQSGISLRVLDILACEGFLLTNWQPEIEEYFTIGKELVTYDTFEDLIEKAEYYLNHPQERRAIAKAGKKKVEELFSYHNALDTIFQKSQIIPQSTS